MSKKTEVKTNTSNTNQSEDNQLESSMEISEEERDAIVALAAITAHIKAEESGTE
tara:strand:+ start:391 stop:555 length:165 start_codon:yes stop_codon:yes gene_type:complete